MRRIAVITGAAFAQSFWFSTKEFLSPVVMRGTRIAQLTRIGSKEVEASDDLFRVQYLKF